jgi:hypothetical protein
MSPCPSTCRVFDRSERPMPRANRLDAAFCARKDHSAAFEMEHRQLRDARCGGVSASKVPPRTCLHTGRDGCALRKNVTGRQGFEPTNDERQVSRCVTETAGIRTPITWSRERFTDSRHHIRRTLVAAEVALAVMLVIGAGLLIRTVHNLTTVDAGFDRSRLVTFSMTLAEPYDPDTRAPAYQRSAARLRDAFRTRLTQGRCKLPPWPPTRSGSTAARTR